MPYPRSTAVKRPVCSGSVPPYNIYYHAWKTDKMFKDHSIDFLKGSAVESYTIRSLRLAHCKNHRSFKHANMDNRNEYKWKANKTLHFRDCSSRMVSWTLCIWGQNPLHSLMNNALWARIPACWSSPRRTSGVFVSKYHIYDSDYRSGGHNRHQDAFLSMHPYSTK